MSKTNDYVFYGAVTGLIGGTIFGMGDALYHSNDVIQTLHNVSAENRNLFSGEYWIMARDAAIGLAGCTVLGGLAGLVHDGINKYRNKKR